MTFRDEMMRRYSLPSSNDFDDCDERLTGIAFRDQQLGHPDFETVEARRAAMHRAARGLVEEASKAVAAIASLRALRDQFEGAAFNDGILNAPLLEEVFNISYVDPSALEPPADLFPLFAVCRTHLTAWEEVERDLALVAGLPVRAKGRTNSVRNHALEQALIAIRLYWVGKLGRPWSRYVLRYPAIQELDQRGELKGPCERFVADMLTAHSIDFTLTTLDGAWAAMEKRLRQKAR